MRSVWQETAELPHFAPLQGNVKTGVLIIGGGITGILCAYFLEQAGVDYRLLEAAELCGGVTGYTAAKLTSQHGLIYDKLRRLFGLEGARIYLEANEAALAQYRALCRGIDCDYQEQDAYVYSLDHRSRLEKELAVLNALGFPAELVSQPALPFPTAGALRFPGQAQFHPLKFLAAISRGLHIHERSKVLELAPGEAKSHQGRVQAEKIIIATH